MNSRRYQVSYENVEEQEETAIPSKKRPRETEDEDWNQPAWYQEKKHGLLNPKLKTLDGFPITSSKLPSLGANEIIADGIKALLDGNLEGRSILGGSIQSAKKLGNNYYYALQVDGMQQAFALYGSVIGGYRSNKDTEAVSKGNMKEEIVVKVKLDNVSCDDVIRLQGKPTYEKTADGEFIFIPPEERGVNQCRAFEASRKCWNYAHATDVARGYLGNIGFFAENPSSDGVDPNNSAWVDRLIRDVNGKLDPINMWDASKDKSRIQYRTGFTFPVHAEKEGDVVKEYRDYFSDDAKPSFRFELPVYRKEKDSNDFLFLNKSERQTFEKEKNKSKPMEVKKISPDGEALFPDVDEFMTDFAPNSGVKNVMILFKYMLIQSDKKGAAGLKPKVSKFIYTCEDNVTNGNGTDDFA